MLAQLRPNSRDRLPVSRFFHDPIVRDARRIRARIELGDRLESQVGKSPSWRILRRRLSRLVSTLCYSPTSEATEAKRRKYNRTTGKMTNAEFAAAHFPGAIVDKTPKNPGALTRALDLVASAKDRAVAYAIFVRLLFAAAEWHQRGWFPVMITLTYSDEHGEEVLNTKLSEYIRALGRRAARAAGLSGKEANKKWRDYIEYFAVNELGKRNKRRHIHILCGLAAIPEEWQKDPNAGKSCRYKREIYAARDLWEYGISQFKPCRYVGDPWGERLKWSWPEWVNRQNEVEFLPTAGLTFVSAYVVKYVAKSLASRSSTSQPGAKQWRIKQTRNLGMTPIKMLVKPLTFSELTTTLTTQASRLETTKILDILPPPRLIKIAAQQRIRDLMRQMPTTKLNRFRSRLLALRSRPTLPPLLRTSLATLTDATTSSWTLTATASMTKSTPPNAGTTPSTLTFPELWEPEKIFRKALDIRKKLLAQSAYVEALYQAAGATVVGLRRCAVARCPVSGRRVSSRDPVHAGFVRGPSGQWQRPGRHDGYRLA